MINLNQQNQNLLDEISKNIYKNTLLVANAFASNKDVLQQSIDAVKLTPEEEAASNVTIQRIEIEEQIDRYILCIRWAYILHWWTLKIPSYLKYWAKKTQSVYGDFFSNLDSLSANVINTVETTSWISKATVLEQYTNWQGLKVKESLNETAINKVNNAIDLRSCLIHILRYQGYSSSEIDEAMNR